jgi:hypothetical protein
MLNAKILKRVKATGKAAPKINKTIRSKRDKICRLIDEFWIYWCNPDKYSALKKSRNKSTGLIEDIWVSGIWPHRHHIIRKDKAFFVISIKTGNRYLPLTLHGEEEIHIKTSEKENIEEILASIKASVQNGEADKWL